MHVIDSHTGGEPTRVILHGGPDLGSGSLAERAEILARNHQDFIRAVLGEPRGRPAMVAALVVPPVDPECAAGVIFFDLDAVLGMCGHGTIGLAVTLAHKGQIDRGTSVFETPVGKVEVDVIDANTVVVQNITSYVWRDGQRVNVDGLGPLSGEIAYGGNWFYLIDPSPIPVTRDNISALTEAGIAIRTALAADRVYGEGSAPIDHIIFYGPSDAPEVQSCNFVLCPDNAYDRSPCGTGCSARLACLAADGRLAPGDVIIQESIIGSRYQLSYQPSTGGVTPSIQGQAWIMAEARLHFDPNDPFRTGIVSG